jgi:hypothetical protein
MAGVFITDGMVIMHREVIGVLAVVAGILAIAGSAPSWAAEGRAAEAAPRDAILQDWLLQDGGKQ